MGNSEKPLSELRKVLTYERFCEAFKCFIMQADENVISKKATGSRRPFGIYSNNRDKSGKLIIDGGSLGQQYGQGAASKTPYFNWHVVSIYYVPIQQRIILGIETGRYPSLEKLQPYKVEGVRGRESKIAVFDEYNKAQIDYKKLYENFIGISERIMQIGL